MPYFIMVNGQFISNENLFGPVYGEIEFHPAVAGAGAVPKLLLAGGLIAASFYMPAAFPLAIKTGLVSLGASLALQGITQLISPPRKATEDKSFNLLNPFNTSPQGTPVPILVGEFFIPLGSAVVLSSSTEIRDIPVSGGWKSSGTKFFGK
jgi:predicted phage tail protein